MVTLGVGWNDVPVVPTTSTARNDVILGHLQYVLDRTTTDAAQSLERVPEPVLAPVTTTRLTLDRLPGEGTVLR